MSKKKISGKSLVICIGREHIRIAQTMLGETSPTLSDERVIDTPYTAVDDGELMLPDAIKAVLAPVLAESAYNRIHQVVFSLATSKVIQEQVSVPRVSGAKLDALLAANLDVYFPVDVQDYVIAHEPIGDAVGKVGSTEQRLQLWATPKALLRPYYTLANSMGLSVAAIEWFGHSLMNAVGASYGATAAKKGKKGGRAGKEPATDTTADTGTSTEAVDLTSLYLLAEPEYLLMSFVRQGRAVLQRVLRRESGDAEFSEAQIVLDFYHTLDVGRNSDIRAALVGSIDNLDGYAERLSAELDIPVSIAFDSADPAWLVCEGAAGVTLDFGSDEFNRVSQPRDQIGQLWQYALVLAGGLAVIGALLFTVISRVTWDTAVSGLQSQQNSVMIRLQEETSRYADVRDQYAEYANAYITYSNYYDALDTDVQILENSVRTYNGNLVLMLLELESILPEGTSVLTIGIGDEGLGLEFRCGDKQEAAYLIRALRELEYADLETVSTLSLQRSGGATGYAVLPSLQAILAAEAAQQAEEAAQQQALLEALLAAAAEENAEEAPPEEGGSDGSASLDGDADTEPIDNSSGTTDNDNEDNDGVPGNIVEGGQSTDESEIKSPYETDETLTVDQRKAALEKLVDSDTGWNLLLESIVSQDKEYFDGLVSMINQDQNQFLMYLHENYPDDEDRYFYDLIGLKSRLDDIKTTVKDNDAEALGELLVNDKNDYRDVLTVVMMYNDETMRATELLIEKNEELKALYDELLNPMPDDGDDNQSGDDDPTVVPTLETVKTLSEDELRTMLQKLGVLDEDGNPVASKTNDNGSLSGAAAATADGEPVYFAAVLRYKPELIQAEFQSKEAVIEQDAKLIPVGVDSEVE